MIPWRKGQENPGLASPGSLARDSGVHVCLGIAEPRPSWAVQTVRARECFCFQKQGTYYDFSSNSKISIKLSL